MRNPVGLICVYPPTHPNLCSKMVHFVDFKRYIAKGFKSPKNICLYMIFDWLSISFRYAVKLKDDLMLRCTNDPYLDLWSRGKES